MDSSVCFRESGSLAYTMNQMGIPALVTESGAAFRIKYDFCEQIIEGIFAVMKELGIWNGPVSPREKFRSSGKMRFLYEL